MDYLLIVPPLAGDSTQLSAPERSEGRAGMRARGARSARKGASAWQHKVYSNTLWIIKGGVCVEQTQVKHLKRNRRPD